jgi:WD40 repeat protein
LFNANGTILITSDNCGNIYFWDISVGESKLVFHKLVRGGGGYVPLKLNPDGTLLAVGGGHGVLIMNAATGDGLFSLPSEWKINDMDFSSDGKYIAAGGIGENVEVWDLSLPGEKLVLTAHGGHRTGDVSFSPDGKRLATESADASEASVWDMATGKRLLAIQSPGICCTLAFSPDGARLAIGSLNGDLKIWDATTGKLASVLSGHTDAISRVAFSPDGTRIATAGSDGIVKIWDAHTYKELLSFIVRNGGTVNFIVFSPDSKLLATTDNDASNANGETIIWDAKTGKLLFFLGFTGTNVGGLAFSPDGKHLAAGYFDNLARIWDISPIKDQSKPLLELYGHSSVVWRVAFSPDGNRLVTASYDGTIKLWDISQGPTQGQEIATLTGHTAEVSGIAFSPDGKYLASVSWDGTLRVYFMQLEDLIAYAKTRVTRTLTTEECQKYLHVDACPVSP